MYKNDVFSLKGKIAIALFGILCVSLGFTCIILGTEVEQPQREEWGIPLSDNTLGYYQKNYTGKLIATSYNYVGITFVGNKIDSTTLYFDNELQVSAKGELKITINQNYLITYKWKPAYDTEKELLTIIEAQN